MQSVKRSALVNFSAAQMYRLVNDVEKYPEFIKGCTSATIIRQDNQSMVARLDIKAHGMNHHFETENQLEPDQRIVMRLHSGPFKHLQGEWRFLPLSEQACKIEFSLEFEFNHSLLSMAFSGMFKALAESMMQSFIERAKLSANEHH